ncbi:LuxR C-terminal-related transcriptional regulator [Mycobacterium sp. C31M]
MSVLMAGETTRSAGGGRPKTEWWSKECELLQRLILLREKAAAVLCRPDLPQIGTDASVRSGELIAELSHACVDGLHRTPSTETATTQDLCDLVLGSQGLALDWYLFETAMRSQRLADCATGLARLRSMPSSAALIDSACDELVLRCGFHRAVLSTVGNGGWKPLILLDRSEPSARSWFSDWINQTVPLTSTTPEALALRRRRPALIHDTADAPVYRPLIVQAGQSLSYVVAPLVHGNDVIGFLHTDHHPRPRRVDEGDRDVLWAFADGFSHIYERTVLMEQLREQRDGIRELFFGAVDRLDELCESGMDMTRSHEEQPEVTIPGGPGQVELTERETEVFELMVTGASNHEIADRLVITEGTVKSHVKHILRKYGAVNRAQAIAWALRAY